MPITLIKGALSSIYRALFPIQICLNVPFGMRNPAVPRSLAGSQGGSPEAGDNLSPRSETHCCSSLARSCSARATCCMEEKSTFVCVKRTEKLVTLLLRSGPDSSSEGKGIRQPSSLLASGGPQILAQHPHHGTHPWGSCPLYYHPPG